MTDTKLETYRGFTNTWECDENNHLNVRFYYQRFEIAAAHLFAMTGITWDSSWVASRHVRYVKECHADQVIVGYSYVSADAPLTIAHSLHDADTNEVLATSVDLFHPTATNALSKLSLEPTALDSSFGGRGVEGGVDSEPRLGAELLKAGYLSIDRTLVMGGHVGPDMRFHLYQMIGRASDGVAHAWTHAGFTTPWLNANNKGRVAVEMNLTVLDRPVIGTPLHTVSGIMNVSRSVMRYRHVLLNALTDRPIAIINKVGVIMDLKERKAIQIPDDIAAIAKGRLVSP